MPSKDCACKSLCNSSDAGGLLIVNSAISGGCFELNLTIFDVVPFLLYLLTLTLPWWNFNSRVSHKANFLGARPRHVPDYSTGLTPLGNLHGQAETCHLP